MLKLFLASGTNVLLVGLAVILIILAVIIIAREFIVTSLRIVAISKGVVIAAEMTGKIKTVIQIIATVIALLFNGDKFAIGTFSAGYVAMLIATLFTIYSGIVYLRNNWNLISESK